MAKKIWNMVGNIAGLVGVSIALLIGLIAGIVDWTVPVWLLTVFVLTGIVIGFLNIARTEAKGFMISVLVLVALGVGGVVAPFPAMVGTIVSSMASVLLAVMLPAGVVVALKTMITSAGR